MYILINYKQNKIKKLKIDIQNNINDKLFLEEFFENSTENLLQFSVRQNIAHRDKFDKMSNKIKNKIVISTSANNPQIFVKNLTNTTLPELVQDLTSYGPCFSISHHAINNDNFFYIIKNLEQTLSIHE